MCVTGTEELVDDEAAVCGRDEHPQISGSLCAVGKGQTALQQVNKHLGVSEKTQFC
jgi:hypothetical protein